MSDQTKTQTQKGVVSQQTLFLVVAVTFVVGFISGVVFTSYKQSKSGMTATAQAKPSPENIEKMAKALEEKAAQEPKNGENWIQLGNLYFDHDLPEKAITAYEKAVELDPKNPNVLTDLGVMYRKAAKPQKALESFERAIAADTKHEAARFNKGVVLMHDLNDEAGALKAWKELAQINPLFTAPGGQSLDELIRHFDQHK